MQLIWTQFTLFRIYYRQYQWDVLSKISFNYCTYNLTFTILCFVPGFTNF